MEKAKFLETIRNERARWDALLAQVDEGQMTVPGIVGAWSVKDLIAHVTWSEREMVGMLRERALVGSDLWNLALDARNVAIYEENRGRTLGEVRAESQAIFEGLIRLLEQLPEADLNDARAFPGMPTDWQPWDVIAGNTYRHYRDHILDVRAWLETHKDHES